MMDNLIYYSDDHSVFADIAVLNAKQGRSCSYNTVCDARSEYTLFVLIHIIFLLVRISAIFFFFIYIFVYFFLFLLTCHVTEYIQSLKGK